MGESSSVGAGALSGHRLISPRRNLWPGVPDSPGRSIDPSNIAEGCGRDGDPELSRFCIIARGSASELEYQLLLARDLKLSQLNDYEQLSQQTIEIKRMLTVLVQKLNRNLCSSKA